MNLLKKNNIAASVSWEENKLAGKEWFRSFQGCELEAFLIEFEFTKNLQVRVRVRVL